MDGMEDLLNIGPMDKTLCLRDLALFVWFWKMIFLESWINQNNQSSIRHFKSLFDGILRR